MSVCASAAHLLKRFLTDLASYVPYDPDAVFHITPIWPRISPISSPSPLKRALSSGRWLIRYRNHLLVSQRAEGFVTQTIQEFDARDGYHKRLLVYLGFSVFHSVEYRCERACPASGTWIVYVPIGARRSCEAVDMAHCGYTFCRRMAVAFRAHPRIQRLPLIPRHMHKSERVFLCDLPI
jgi:hypothetical protein